MTTFAKWSTFFCGFACWSASGGNAMQRDEKQDQVFLTLASTGGVAEQPGCRNAQSSEVTPSRLFGASARRSGARCCRMTSWTQRWVSSRSRAAATDGCSREPYQAAIDTGGSVPVPVYPDFASRVRARDLELKVG